METVDEIKKLSFNCKVSTTKFSSYLLEGILTSASVYRGVKLETK